MGVGTALGREYEATVLQGVLFAEAPVTSRVGISTWLGASRNPLGELGLLDAVVQAPILVASGDSWFARVEPGLALPTGAAGTEGVATFRSTGSADPLVSAMVSGGATVVGMGRVTVRPPLYEGRDGVQDGTFLRADALMGTRIGAFVPVGGLSWLQQAADANGSRAYSELSAVVGSSVHLSDDWGVDAQLRIPLIATDAPIAGVVQATRVVGAPR